MAAECRSGEQREAVVAGAGAAVGEGESGSLAGAGAYQASAVIASFTINCSHLPDIFKEYFIPRLNNLDTKCASINLDRRESFFYTFFLLS